MMCVLSKKISASSLDRRNHGGIDFPRHSDNRHSLGTHNYYTPSDKELVGTESNKGHIDKDRSKSRTHKNHKKHKDKYTRTKTGTGRCRYRPRNHCTRILPLPKSIPVVSSFTPVLSSVLFHIDTIIPIFLNGAGAFGCQPGAMFE